MRCMCGAPHLTSVAGHHGSPPIIMMLHQRSPRVLGRVTAAHHLAIILACVTPCASPTSARNIAVHVFPLAPPRSCQANAVILNCGHVVACVRCCERFTACPVCRKPMERLIRIYRG